MSPENAGSGRAVDNIFPNLFVAEKVFLDKYKMNPNHEGKLYLNGKGTTNFANILLNIRQQSKKTLSLYHTGLYWSNFYIMPGISVKSRNFLRRMIKFYP
jgi:hypothetical protein